VKKSSAEIAALLLCLEQSLLDPIVRRDRSRLLALLADDFEEIGASGRTWTLDEIVDSLAGEAAFQPPEIEDFRCREIAVGVVLVTYRAVRRDLAGGLVTASLRSSLWRKTGGIWRMCFHQGTPAW
jgi:hypothetical protein